VGGITLNVPAVLAAIGDILRFENARQLVGYAGLEAGVHDSGKTHNEKKITKSVHRLAMASSEISLSNSIQMHLMILIMATATHHFSLMSYASRLSTKSLQVGELITALNHSEIPGNSITCANRDLPKQIHFE